MHLSPEQKTLLKVRWDEGLPASVIGKEFGLSRSAVLGHAHRMQLAPRRVERRAPVQDWAKRRRYWDRSTGMVRLKGRPGEQHMRVS